MVSTEDNTETTTTPYKNTDNERKKRYLLIGTVFICYTIIYIIVILLAVTASKPNLDIDSTSIKAEAILLDASITPYNLDSKTLNFSALDNTANDVDLIGNDLAGITQADGKVTKYENFELVSDFYLNYLIGFEIDIERLFKIYNDHSLKKDEQSEKVKAIMESEKPIYKLVKLFGTLQKKYYDLIGKVDKSKTMTKEEMQQDVEKKQTQICTVCESAIATWLENNEKSSKLQLYPKKEDAPDGKEFVNKWPLGFVVCFGNYAGEFPGSIGTVHHFMEHSSEIWDKEIYKEDKDKDKRTGYKKFKDLGNEDGK